jgi:hypothetical protein
MNFFIIILSNLAGYPAGYLASLVSGIRPDIWQVKSGIRPDIKKGELSGQI